MWRRVAERVRAWPVDVVRAVPGSVKCEWECCEEEGRPTSMWERQGDSRVRTKSMARASGSSVLSLAVGVGVGLMGEARCDGREPEEGGEMGWEKLMAVEDGLSLGKACGCWM